MHLRVLELARGCRRSGQRRCGHTHLMTLYSSHLVTQVASVINPNVVSAIFVSRTKSRGVAMGGDLISSVRVL